MDILMLEKIVYIALIMTNIALGSKLIGDYKIDSSINYTLLFFELLAITVLLVLSFEFFKKEPTLEQLQKKWKFKNKEAALEYINKYKNHLRYEKEDKDRLSLLLFFNWTIVSENNDELLLERKNNDQIKKMIFKPKNNIN